MSVFLASLPLVCPNSRLSSTLLPGRAFKMMYLLMSLLYSNSSHGSQLLQMPFYKLLENLIPVSVSGCFSSAPLPVVSHTRPFSVSQTYSSFSYLCALVDAFLFTWGLEEGRRMQLSLLFLVSYLLSPPLGHLGRISFSSVF